jgi:NADH-ubiquinone oxidoreductase chain 5
MIVSIVLAPLIGFLSGIIFGRYIGKGAGIITTLLIIFCFINSYNTIYDIIVLKNIYVINVQQWIYSDLLQLNWSFYFDSLTVIMLMIVCFISALVHLYSNEYMEQDPHLPRFMSYLSLFTFFMIILVTGNNFLQMFVGWEGVGLSSYLLINFWFTRIQANKSAIKAMLVNRVGDFFILIGIFSLYLFTNTLDYSVIFNLSQNLLNNEVILLCNKINAIDLICLCLFLGAMGKSAQIGLHTWLPDAMEGPTPVSALIHAATMVTAGVFLVTRCSYLFENSPFVLNIITFVGSMTAIFAATTGLFQNDMKKVIAYSTCSQLGYMVFACGLSSYDIGIFHLSNHAFFKALLFLSAGSVIHAMSDEQDMRKMGGLKNILPFSYASSLIGSFALVGFPFLAGYYSKDAILEVASVSYTVIGQYAYYLGLFAAFCTSYYSTRLILLVFLSNTNSNKKIMYNAHEPNLPMSIPLFLLSLLSIFIGYLTRDMFIGLGSDFWNTSIFVLYDNCKIIEAEFLDTYYKIIPLILTIMGSLIAYTTYTLKIGDYFALKQTKTLKNVFYFFNKKWFFDRLYNQILVQFALKASLSYFYVTVDRGLIEKIGPIGLHNGVYFVVNQLKNLKFKLLSDHLQLLVISILVFVHLNINLLN